ncbi:GFA family protein [Sphingorhabdus sp. EL138]|uniref:GFA family protein n=1 Tax=Sphingorhabdus sp. EL138 TaxID=2073156 RepID=UPI0020B14375|nr:GFA family protein [Sphingorhabdus sp. EL138]
MQDTIYRGSCLCGAVTIAVKGDLPGPNVCHCSQCRKQSGHYWASTDVPRDRLTVEGDENLRWYQSSEKVRRGFCETCGSFLFWDPVGRETIAVSMGTFDGPTQTKLSGHIFVADKGDYYTIADGLPQEDQ